MAACSKIQSGILFSLFLIYPHLSLHSETGLDFRGDQTVNYFSRYTDIVIETDRVLFDYGVDVPIRFRITNSGYQIVRIYPSSEMNRSFQFMVIDSKGRELESGNPDDTRKLKNKRLTAVVNLQGEPIKEIILHPNETYEKIINLNDFFQLEPGSEYRVSGYFFPDIRQEFFVRTSNYIKIRISRDKKKSFLTEEYGVKTNPQNPSLTPEETVYLFLSAEIKNNWSNYLKYLHLNKYITSYDRYATRYIEASDMERSQILKEFGDYLTGRKTEKLKRFKILEVTHDLSANGGILPEGRTYVKVQADRDIRGYVERYEYVYSLEKFLEKDGFWKIVHVTARLLK